MSIILTEQQDAPERPAHTRTDEYIVAIFLLVSIAFLIGYGLGTNHGERNVKNVMEAKKR